MDVFLEVDMREVKSLYVVFYLGQEFVMNFLTLILNYYMWESFSLSLWSWFKVFVIICNKFRINRI